MPAFRPGPRAALVAACIGLAAAHAPAHATRDLPIVVQTCPMEAGRDPSVALFSHACGVWSPDDFANVPSWNVLELMAIDGGSAGGRVAATLHCMSRSTGAVSTVAKVKSLPSGTAVKKATVRIAAPLDFARCGYFVRVDVDARTTPAQALMVSLRH